MYQVKKIFDGKTVLVCIVSEESDAIRIVNSLKRDGEDAFYSKE